MLFQRSIAAKSTLAATTKAKGDSAEALALQHLLAHGLVLVARNFKTPGRGGGEIDLILRDVKNAGTLVFVEVRQRKAASHGGALASISATKRRRIVFAAQHFLSRYTNPPPCRFDVVALDGVPPRISWLRAAFDAG